MDQRNFSRGNIESGSTSNESGGSESASPAGLLSPSEPFPPVTEARPAVPSLTASGSEGQRVSTLQRRSAQQTVLNLHRMSTRLVEPSSPKNADGPCQDKLTRRRDRILVQKDKLLDHQSLYNGVHFKGQDWDAYMSPSRYRLQPLMMCVHAPPVPLTGTGCNLS